MINIQFQYGIPNISVKTSTNATGKALDQDSLVKVSTGENPKGMARIESKRNLRYRTGHEGYAFFTALWETSAAQSTQFIGLLDEQNGAAVGFNGTAFSILFRREGDADRFIPQSQFNRDTIDGNGPSGFKINTTTLNIFRVSYGWLGTAPIKFQVCSEKGSWITFHVLETPNSVPGVHFKNPVLPIAMEVKNNGNTTNLTMGTASWNAGIVGPPSTSSSRYFSATNGLNLGVVGTESHVLTIRNKDTFKGKRNKVEVRISSLGGGIITGETTSVITRIIKQADSSGLTFKDIDSENSVIEVSTRGDFANSSGRQLFALPMISGSAPTTLFFPQNQFDIILHPGESITITGENVVGGTPMAIVTVTWEERF